MCRGFVDPFDLQFLGEVSFDSFWFFKTEKVDWVSRDCNMWYSTVLMYPHGSPGMTRPFSNDPFDVEADQ